MKNKFWFYSIIILTKKIQRKVIPTFTLFFFFSIQAGIL